MKTTLTRRARQKSWEGKKYKINEIIVEDKIMDQILDELTEILYLEFSQLIQDQDSLSMMGCSLKIKKDIA